MNSILPGHLFLIDFSTVAQDYSFIFYLAILTLAFSVVLRTTKLFIIQLLLFLALGFPAISSFTAVFAALQVGLTTVTIYKYLKALDRNYNLVIEKTHEIPPNITSGSQNGSQSSFF
ncbi:hypothetical protein CIL03_10735 [Virgibacillus indicus]|uniref:Uncharacterized protein n=1 Tax=Virgibacillus indicus TaxID=2024554 RepID=A0A265NBC2_9BACI|nr:hypothetical protein [Virgibacillus indicus]OZU88754.1 hypothetical protein CIL03_10735 [Virgibacillus indicus]